VNVTNRTETGRLSSAPPEPDYSAVSIGSSGIQSHLASLDPAYLRDLLLRCGDGDREAFDEYYRLTSPVLASLIAARRLPPSEADSILIDVYVTIWRRANRFQISGRSVWQWTLTVLLDTLSLRLNRPDLAQFDRSNDQNMWMALGRVT
jgi:hypothetical protein